MLNWRFSWENKFIGILLNQPVDQQQKQQQQQQRKSQKLHRKKLSILPPVILKCPLNIL